MSNYLTTGDVKRGTQAMVGLMVFLFEDVDGITPKDLSTFTSFFNPYSDPTGAWTQEDRDVYTQGFDSYPWSTATEKVELYWDKGPAYDTTNGRMITRWWDDKENFNYTVVFQLYITIEAKTQYFGYLP